ncbi:MAG TPA: alpha amylase C-terminal domain-containing protein [Bryobacteraceae bacterium]|nr:alpha amylase C-terminal domain-containing protein [Bryobacteraceae bacterium]
MTTTLPDLTTIPMGGNLAHGGATFRIWAPRAKNVYICGDFNSWAQDASSLLTPIGSGHWAGFVPDLKDGDAYLFYVDGPGTSGYKRDPYGRLLTVEPAFPNSNCVLRNPSTFPWHQTGYHAPAFNDLIIYQLHVGTFSIQPGNAHGNFLDVIAKIPYLAALGVNAIEPLPIQEFPTQSSLGYNGTDYFSPENEYAETADGKLNDYFDSINSILRQAEQSAYASVDVLRDPDSQLRALIDVCHVYGIAVLFDVVYNHAGGGFDENSPLWYTDRMPYDNKNDSLYFTEMSWAGGQVFAYWNDGVKQFLIDNARFLYQEYRIDGLRFDEVSVMDHFGGWGTCQFITETLRYLNPCAIQVAEYWPVNDYIVKDAYAGGAGFDATWTDWLRTSVRAALNAAACGSSASVDMASIAGALTNSLDNRWRSVSCLENHDLVYTGRDQRIAQLSDSSNSRSWYARSRSRFAMGMLMAAPGIPLLFMGQEFLEDKQWSDTPNVSYEIWWQGLDSGDKTMSDFLRFTRELIALRKSHPALRGEGGAVTHVHSDNRVIVIQRWVEGIGADVMIAATLSETNRYNYQIGFPSEGRWNEIFNSDVYDNWVNPSTAGNGGGVNANGPAMHGLSASAAITIPANGFVVFTRA